MAIRAWKKFEQSRFLKRPKLFAKRLIGRELRLRREIDLPAVEHSDWWFYPPALGTGAVVYSLGVGEDTAFDCELIGNHGAQVFAFDPTPNTAAWISRQTLPEAFHFYPWAVTGADGVLTLYPRSKKDGSQSKDMFTMVPEAGAEDSGVDVPAYCLRSLMIKLGHERIDLLKIDIEGAEYEVLASLLDSGDRPVQILVEFHHRFASIGKAATVDIIRRLRAAGYRIFAISSTGREVSFYRPANGSS